jgi:predicted MPP superfamily phosphohydrolase
MRFFILFAILLAIDFYAFQGFRTLAQHWSANAKTVLYSFFWAIPLLTLFYFFASSADWTANWGKATVTFVRTFIFIAYLSKFLLIPLLLVDDVRRLATMAYHGLTGEQEFDPGRSRFLTQMGIFLAAIPFMSLTYGVIRNAYRYKVFRKTLHLDDLPEGLDGLRIVQISDIHSGSFTFREPIRNAIELINRQDADLVFFTGDLVNSRADEMEPYIDIFDKIEARHGVFSILGNHDYGDYHDWPSRADKEANMEKLKATHRQLGWELLLNEHRQVEINGERIAVIGVENYSTHSRFPKYGDLEHAYRGAEDAGLKLLLSHDPTHWREQVTNGYDDIAVTFSGHTHGMQFGVEIQGLFRWSPIKYVYKDWAGLYTEGKQHLYVNRGLGFLGYPGRVGILPEITVMELRRSV